MAYPLLMSCIIMNRALGAPEHAHPLQNVKNVKVEYSHEDNGLRINPRTLAPCSGFCWCNATYADCSRNYGNLTYVPVLVKGITFLNFSFNNVTTIHGDFFANVTNITGLDLSNNDIVFISKWAFRVMTRLVTLIIESCALSTTLVYQILSFTTFNETSTSYLWQHVSDDFRHYPLSHLEVLNMYENKLGTLNFTLFKRFVNLTHLQLGNCQIGPVVFDFMLSLRMLHLETNGIVAFITCRNNASLFPRLEHLLLRANALVSLEETCLPNLQFIDLSLNHFLFIPPYMFKASHFPSLKYVHFSFIIGLGQGKRIYRNAFSNPNILLISLQDSGLHFALGDVDPDAFANCSSLRELYLQYNFCRDITDQQFNLLFSHLLSLKVMHLSYNEINKITANTFKALTAIEEIYIFGNSLVNIPDGAFDDLINLTILSVSINRLQVIKETTLNEATRLRLKSLDLSGNAFMCSCDLMWFRQWLLSDVQLFSKSWTTYNCYNIPNTYVTSEYLNDQACLFDRDVNILLTVSVSLLLFILVMIFAVYRLRWHIRLLLYEMFHGNTRHEKESVETQHFKYDVFVSFAKQDLTWVLDHLVPELEGRMGKSLCVHVRDFLPGKNIVDNIVDSLLKSRKIMLVFSNNFSHSQWCQFELSLCLHHVIDHNEDLLVVCLQDLHVRHMTAAMLAILKTSTYIQWDENSDSHTFFWGRLKSALE